MEETYNGHNDSRLRAWQLSEAGKWEPRVFITWNEGSEEKKAPLVFTRPFTDELEAEKAKGSGWQKMDRRRKTGVPADVGPRRRPGS